MKYYFVDNVRVSDGVTVPVIVPPTKKKTTSKGIKKSGKGQKASAKQEETMLVLKLRTVQRVPTTRPADIPRLARLNRRQGPLATQTAQVGGRVNPRGATMNRSKVLRSANAEKNIATPGKKRSIAAPTGTRHSPRLRRANTSQPGDSDDSDSEDSSTSTASQDISPPRPDSGRRDAAGGNESGTQEEQVDVTVNQVVSNSQEPQEREEGGFLCPTAKVRAIAWGVPFMLTLDYICEAGTDLQSLYSNHLPAEEEMRTFNSRTRRYGAIEEAVGAIAYELNEQLGLDIPVSRRTRPTSAELIEAKRRFERKYMRSMALIKNFRNKIGAIPSIFWWYPTDVIFRMFSRYHGEVGVHNGNPEDNGTAQADALHARMFGQYVSGLAFADNRGMVRRFFECDTTSACSRSQWPVYEHACRAMQETDEYESGLKETLPNNRIPNPTEGRRTFWLRSSTFQTEPEYANAMMGVQGFTYNPDEGRHMRDHPLTDLASALIGFGGLYLKRSYMDAPIQVVSALCTEMDTAMMIAHDTPTPTTVAERGRDIYGHRDGGNYHIKPWNVMQNVATFHSQLYTVGDALTGVHNQRPTPDDYVEFFDAIRFHILVHDFQEFYRWRNDDSRSILADRLRTSPHLLPRAPPAGNNNS